VDVKRGVVVEQDVDDGRNGNRHRDSKDVAYVARGWDPLEPKLKIFLFLLSHIVMRGTESIKCHPAAHLDK